MLSEEIVDSYLNGSLSSLQVTRELEKLNPGQLTLSCPICWGFMYVPKHDGITVFRRRRDVAALVRAVNPTLPRPVLPNHIETIEALKNPRGATPAELENRILGYFCRSISVKGWKRHTGWEEYASAYLANMLISQNDGASPSAVEDLVRKYGATPNAHLRPGKSFWTL